jgi:ankyrin repeat protein
MSQQFLKYIQRGATVEIADAVAADPTLLAWRDAQGVSALMWAIYSGQALVRDFLLVEMERTGVALDAFESAAAGNTESLAKALAAAPETSRLWSEDGWTALHLAAAFGAPEAVQLLIDSGAPVDAVSKNPQTNQPLHAALALGRNPETIRLLLHAGANPNARQTAGFTAIFSAAAANRRDLCELLIQHGADANLSNDFGQTAAGFARERSHTELADWLDTLSATKDPN